MNIHEIEEQEHFDGYRNEFQRAAAWSSMNRPADQRLRALSLVQDGRFVAVCISPVHCRCTDAVIGDFVSILGDFATRAEAIACIEARQWDCDDRPEVWPHSVRETPVCAPVENDDIPF